MPVLLIGSLHPGEGRTTAVAAIGAILAESGRDVRLLRVRSDDEDPAAVADDAAALALVPRCASPGQAITEQDALAQTRDADASGAVCVLEAPAGSPADLAARLSARVVLVTDSIDDLRIGDLASTATSIGDRFAGVIAARQPARLSERVPAALAERGLRCLGVVPEDRLLAGPSVREIAEALHASRLYENSPDDEGLEYVMLGPITSDPGQPYFYRHGRKAVVNRFDKMDLHLAALATDPECLVLTGGQQPSPYLMDRVANSGLDLTVLLAPEGTVRTAELLSELYGQTRFQGSRKTERAIELFRAAISPDALDAVLS